MNQLGNLTDTGLEHVSKLNNLKWLHLGSSPQITDDGIELLAALESLETLNVEFCSGVSDFGTSQLTEKNPNLIVEF